MYKRSHAWYNWNLIFPLFVCNVTAACSWSVHFRQIDSRLGLDVTLLLVAVAFKQFVSGSTCLIRYMSTPTLPSHCLSFFITFHRLCSPPARLLPHFA